MALPPLPEGYTLDAPEQGVPPLPDGYTIDQQPQEPIQQERSFLESAGKTAVDTFDAYIKQPIEVGVSMAGNVVAESAAGLGGLLTLPFDDANQAESNVNAIREFLSVTPPTESGRATLKRVAEAMQPIGETVQAAQKQVGDIVYDATGSPVLGAIGQTAPDALMAATGLKLPKIKPKLPKSKVKRVEPTITEPVNPTKATYEQLATDLKRKRTKKVAAEVRPDVQILKDASDLNVELTPSSYSTNRAYREVEQALKARPGSKIGVIEEKSILDLGTKADEMIKDYGGTLDKSLLDAGVKAKYSDTINKLELKSDAIYKKINDTIPRSTIVKPVASAKLMDDVLEDLGGDISQLTAAEKKLFDLTKSDKPTYALLDRVRKDVGSGFKGQGIYKDVNEGILKRVYGALTEDQNAVSKAFGLGAEYEIAKKLIKSRKDLEKSAQGLLGKELQNSIIPKITQAATNLTKGDTSKFRSLMNALPKSDRAKVSATMLNDMFTLGARNKGALGQGFVNAYKGLNRNKAAKDILFKELPVGARARFDKIGRVAEGIYKAKALENKSRTATAVIQAMDDGGLFSKMYSGVKRIPGAGQVATVTDAFINKVTPAVQVADDLITSPAFKGAIEASVKGNVKKAGIILRNSRAFNKWLKTRTGVEQKQIASVGLIEWLTNNTTNQNKKVK